MPESSLFRSAAAEAQRTQWHGEIIIAQRISYAFLAAIAALLAVLLVAFFFWGTYTKRTTVAGQILPDSGLVKLYARQDGTIVEQRVVEGQHVDRNDVLFVLSTERQSSTVGGTQASISTQTRLRVASLRDQLEKTERLRRLDREGLEKKIEGLRQEAQKLQTLIENQRRRTDLAEKALVKYQQLNERQFVSRENLEQKQADLLDQGTRLQANERDQIATQRNLDDARNQLSTLNLKYDNNIADLNRSVATGEGDYSESEGRRELAVLATETGTATAVTAQAGQIVEANRPLVSIIADGAVWQADLYAPSRAIGFIRPGDSVRIRYQAFPYQKFGQYSGTVTAIATTALSSAELTGGNTFSSGPTVGGEPLYRISVALKTQTIVAYGKEQPLHAGMLVEADLLQETRRLYEWVLEPLYSLSGKL